MTIVYFVERDPESGMYIGIAPSIPGAHTMGETLEELEENLKEVVALCLEELAPDEKELLGEFVSLGKFEVAL